MSDFCHSEDHTKYYPKDRNFASFFYVFFGISWYKDPTKFHLSPGHVGKATGWVLNFAHADYGSCQKLRFL